MYDSLFRILTHGSDLQIDEIIYRRDDLGIAATRIATGILAHHFRAPDSAGSLRAIATIPSGNFSLVVIHASWNEDLELNYTPIIIADADEALSIAGIMLPFNGLQPLLNESDCSDIAELSTAWIIRKTQRK